MEKISFQNSKLEMEGEQHEIPKMYSKLAKFCKWLWQLYRFMKPLVEQEYLLSFFFHCLKKNHDKVDPGSQMHH